MRITVHATIERSRRGRFPRIDVNGAGPISPSPRKAGLLAGYLPRGFDFSRATPDRLVRMDIRVRLA